MINRKDIIAQGPDIAWTPRKRLDGGLAGDPAKVGRAPNETDDIGSQSVDARNGCSANFDFAEGTRKEERYVLFYLTPLRDQRSSYRRLVAAQKSLL